MTSVNLRRFRCKSKYLFARKQNRLIYTILKYHRYFTPEDINSSKTIITKVYKRIDDLEDEEQKQILTNLRKERSERQKRSWEEVQNKRKEQDAESEKNAALLSAENTRLEMEKAMEEAKKKVAEELEKQRLEAEKLTEETKKQEEILKQQQATYSSQQSIMSNISTISGALHGNMAGLVSASLGIVDAFTRMSKAMGEGQASAKDWMSAIIGIVNELKKQDNVLGGILTAMTDVDALFKDVGTTLMSFFVPFGFIKAWIQSARDRAEELATEWEGVADAISDKATEAMRGFRLQIIDVMAEFKRAQLLITTGVTAIQDQISKKQGEIDAFNTKRQKAELEEQIENARRSGDTEYEIHLKNQLDMIALKEEEAKRNEQLKKEEIELDKNIALMKLSIERERVKAEIKMRQADLKARKAEALAEAESIVGKKRRAEAKARIEVAFENASIETSNLTGIQNDLLDLQEKAIKGTLTDADFYANGTSSANAGYGIVGEQGPELVKFRGGESVIPAHETAEIMGNKGGISIVINNPTMRSENDINILADKISRVLGQRMALA